MMSFRGQASWAKMTSPGGELTALVCHLTKRVNKAEELNYLYKQIYFLSVVRLDDGKGKQSMLLLK